MSIASMIDHTLLKQDATGEQIDRLCAEAAEYHFASVCVNPYYVVRCVKNLKGTGVKVCTVVGFPLGATTMETKVFETLQAVASGAEEIDMVINVCALKSGHNRGGCGPDAPDRGPGDGGQGLRRHPGLCQGKGHDRRGRQPDRRFRGHRHCGSRAGRKGLSHEQPV